MGEVHLFPKPNPFIFSTANLLKDQTEYILLYDQNRRMIHWLFQVILHQLMSWYNPVDTILHSFTGWHAGSRQVAPWVHCNSAGLFSTVFVVAHFYSWIVSNGASSPDCSLFTNSYFFWKKADDSWLPFLLSSQQGHSSSSMGLQHSSQHNAELFSVSGFLYLLCSLHEMFWIR